MKPGTAILNNSYPPAGTRRNRAYKKCALEKLIFELVANEIKKEMVKKELVIQKSASNH